jgi:hypothetical protein
MFGISAVKQCQGMTVAECRGTKTPQCFPLELVQIIHQLTVYDIVNIFGNAQGSRVITQAEWVTPFRGSTDGNINVIGLPGRNMST